MDTHQTPEPSVLQDSSLGPGHDVAHANLASQTRETADTSLQDANDRTCYTSWEADPHFDHPHSNFPGSHASYQLSPQQGTGSTLTRSSCPGPFEVDQPPDSPLDIHFNYNNANTDDAAQTHLFPNDPLFPFLSADLRPQYEQPNFPPPPQHVLRGPVPYDHPGSSSTTVEDPGFSLHAGLNEPHGLQGFNTGMASSEQMLGAGPSLLATQEQSPTTQEASRTHEEKHRAKKERDKIRKRNERSTNSLKCASIAELLDISLSPKKTLADRILKAVGELVEKSDRYEESQRRVREAETKVNILTRRVAQLETR